MDNATNGDTEMEDAPAGDDTGTDLAAQLASARADAETYMRNWQRAAADLQNFRRRTEEERADQARLHKAAMIINVLPVFDDLDRAASSVDATLAGDGWVQGILAIHRKFSQLLDAMEVRPIDAVGQQFDPERHEAVGRQPGEEGIVVAELQRGYTLGDRVLRPAMVIVGSGDAAG